MINLLPENRKLDLGSARANLIITRYIGIILLAVVFLIGALATSHSVLKSTLTSAENIIEANDVKAEVFSETSQKVQALDAQLNSAKSILNQEIRLSQVLIKLGKAMPEGAVIGEINFNEESLSGSPIELKAYVKTSPTATQLQSNLQSAGVFSTVSLQGTQENQGIDGYPIAVSLTASLLQTGAQL